MCKIIAFCVLMSYCFKLICCENEELNREELVVTNVTAEFIFPLNLDVGKWKSLTIGPTCYSVGLSDNGIEILTAVLNENKTGFHIKNTFNTTQAKPADAIIFHNRNNGKSEAVFIVSFLNYNKISWFRINDANHVEEFWTWSVIHPVEHLKIFKMASRKILLLVTNRQAQIYEFDVNNNSLNKWLIQTLPLETAKTSSAFNKFRDQYFLSIIQKDSVTIYKFTKTKFEKFTIIKAQKVTSIIEFNIGFKTFFAINGLDAGIYQFTSGGLKKQEIANSNMNGITFWLPVPLQTYRDEVILFSQRVLDHSTHKTIEVDITTYDNVKFEEHEDVPCSLFEETFSWLTCLTHGNGILGSTYLVIEDKIGMIVPRTNNSFILFNIDTKLKQKVNPKEEELHDFLEHKNHLEILIEQSKKTFEEITNLLNPTAEKLVKIKPHREIVGESQNLTSYVSEVDKIALEVDKLYDRVELLLNHEKSSNYRTVFINGDVKFEGTSTITEMEVVTVNGEHGTTLLNDVVSKLNIDKPLMNKTFFELEVDNLKVDTINNIETKDIVFSDQKEIVFNGDVTFKDFAMVENAHVSTKLINDVPFENEAIILGQKHEGSLRFNQIKVESNLVVHRINNVNLQPLPRDKSSKIKRNLSDDLEDTLFIPKNLTVQFINGENFTEFLHSLCLINTTCYIPANVTIREEIHAGNIDVEFLNDLKFSDYILQNNESSADFTGKKIFKNSLKAVDIRSETDINGVNTENLVTLSTDQTLEHLTFNQLELTEGLDVGGKISGETVDMFLKNPTLQDGNNIRSKVNFKNIEVKGNIIVENNFNDKNLNMLLRNLLYDDEDEAIITSVKEFSKNAITVTDLKINSNSINTTPLTKFATKSTDQSLDINLLNGNVEIENLILNGTYDGHHIEEFDESLVKLSGNQFLSSVLSFDDLEVENLEITDKLNDVGAEEYLYVNGEEDGRSNMFENLVVENLIVEGNIVGEIEGFDLKDISERYLSLTKNQSIETAVNINEARVDNLHFSKINNVTSSEIFEEKSHLEGIIKLLNSGQLTVKNLHVEDSLFVNEINDHPAKIIYPGDKLIIENEVYFKEIELTDLSSVNWNDYVEHIVFKNETNSKIVFAGDKQFQNGITVNNLIETKKINNISIENILTKEGNQIVRGPIEVVGDLSLGDIEVKENINGNPVKEFLEKLSVSNATDFTLKRDMVFNRLAYIQSLQIDGLLNDKQPEDLFKEMVYLNSSIDLENDIIFKRPVDIGGNLYISHHFNDLNFSDIISKIVYTTQDADIKSLLTFSKSIEVQEYLMVDDDLSAKFIKDFNTRNWEDKAVYVDKGMLNGHYHLESMVINNDLVTEFINELNMSHVIPLRRNQSIDYLEFRILKFIKDIPVGKTVKSIYLPDEFGRTFMKDTDQDILPTTIFKNNILIQKNLKATFLNDRNTSKIVTVNSKQNLTAIYKFNSKTNLESDLTVTGLINEVDYETWKNNTLKLNLVDEQLIYSEWKVLNNITFEENVESINEISDLDLPKIVMETQRRKNLKYQFENGIIKDYVGMCDTVTYIYEKTKSQIYKFKYLEDFQNLFFSNTIKYVFNFNFKQKNYLFVNKENCMSDILVYNGTQFVSLLPNVPTGLVEQAVAVHGEDTLFLVMRASSWSKCNNIVGTNIWEFDGHHLEVKFNMDDQQLLHQSLIPSTFYSVSKEGVFEYKMKGSEGPSKFKKWEVFEDDVAFIPRGLKTGLAMRTGEKIVFLERSTPTIGDNDLDFDSEAIIKGKVDEALNRFIPGKSEGDIAVVRIGTESNSRSLLAVACHEDTIVKGSIDFIKIYENPLTGQLFDKVTTYNPSSLLSIDFGQGETLLIFLEDKTIIRIYEYKGIEGFKLRSSIKIRKASSLFSLDLTGKNGNPLKTVGIVFKDKIILLQVVMEGTKIRDDLNCNL